MTTQLLCQKTQAEVSLWETRAKDQPVALVVTPAAPKNELFVRLRQPVSLCGVAAHLPDATSVCPTPRYFTSWEQLAPSTFILTKEEEQYAAYLCLSHSGCAVRILGGATGGMRLGIQTEPPSAASLPCLVAARGGNPDAVVATLMQEALSLTGATGKLFSEKQLLPAWVGMVGWDSTGAFGQLGSHESIVNAVWSLKEAGIVPGYALVDSGWLQLDAEGRLTSFEANPLRYPLGLRGLVDELRRAGVEHVGVWHGLQGGRAGVAETCAWGSGPLGQDFGEAFQFFYTFYEALREQGIDFIKVGQQICMDAHATERHRNLQIAIQAAASVQFNSTLLNADCLRNENLFYWTTSRFAGVGEPFDPENPLGVKRFIRNSLFNAYWVRPLMLPDYGSWDSCSKEAEPLAVLHALSGSVNVISDSVGRHRLDLLRRMVLPGGELVQADAPLALCEESLFFDPLEEKRPCKAFTRKGECLLIAAFNLVRNNRSVHGMLSPADAGELPEGQVALYSHRHGFLGAFDRDAQIPFHLKPGEVDIFTIAPIKEGVALIGCYDFFLPPGPLLDISRAADGVHFHTRVAAPVVLYCEPEVLEVRRNGSVIPWERETARHLVTLDKRGQILNLPSEYSVFFEG